MKQKYTVTYITLAAGIIMASLDMALITGKTSLQTNQQRMNIIANNIANAHKPGYHRQSAAIANNQPLDSLQGQLGTGVHVESVIRSYDTALENSLRTALEQDGYFQAYSQQINRLEATLAEKGISPLNEAILGFSNHIQDLANQPESSEKRINLLSQANLIADQFNQTSTDLHYLRDQLADNSANGIIRNQVENINHSLAQIGALNQTISELETRRFNPVHANDLRDQRDQIVNDIARIANITVTETADKAYTISVGNDVLVDGAGITKLSVGTANGVPSIMLASNSQPVTVNGGGLDGLLEAHKYIDSHINLLTDFANEFVQATNTAHQSGFTRSGSGGGPMFAIDNAGIMTVEITNPDNIAASTDANAIGNGDNAQAIWQALNASRPLLNNNVITGHADSLLDQIAAEAAQSRDLADGTTAGVVMFQESVSRRSGVNVDEEMVTMLEVQRAYQATARFISIVDDMFDQILAIV